MGKGQLEATVAVESEEISDSFLCCICLDLLYKPIVLSCGHISCFWCVHKSMNAVHESQCPICRNPYYHFPTICQMLHCLLLKMYPIAYKRREEQILVEERKMDYFSPQLDCNACGLHPNQEYQCRKDHKHSLTTSLESSSCSEPCPNGNCKQVSITDVQCTACKELLYHPVFLNCGHGYCETCIMDPADEMLRCHACQSLHPIGFPKVCLELDHFLEEQFPREYALRRDAVKLEQKLAQAEIDKHTTCSTGANKKDSLFRSIQKDEYLSQVANSGLKVHVGAGCDYCGMYPIIGDRYQCKDCVEKIGFDLCGDCYNTRSKRPGRFNQQHTPDHELELMWSSSQTVLFRLGPERDASFVSSDNDDPSEVPENEFPASVSADAGQSSTGSSLSAPVSHTESSDDENETVSVGSL